MLSKLARGTFLLILAVMIARWALSASKSNPADPNTDQPAGSHVFLTRRRGRSPQPS